METPTQEQLDIKWATPGVLLLFFAVVALLAAIVTFFICRRSLARKRRPSIWGGILGAFLTGFITMLSSYRDYSGNRTSIITEGLCLTLFFMVIGLIPSIAVVLRYRRKTGP